MRTCFPRINFFASFALLSVLCVPFRKGNEHRVAAIHPTLATDTIRPKKIVPDDYPVTDEMFATDIHQNGLEIKSGEIISLDKVWFRNQVLGEVLVFELYTDYFRNIIFHFKSDDIPKELIKNMDLFTAEREAADEKLKEKYFHGFLRSANQVDAKYFHTKKGFKTGDSKEKVIKSYGKPDNISQRDGIEKYHWKFLGDLAYDPKKQKTTKPLAEGSLGHEITMFFRNNKLIALIFYNEIP